MVIAPACANSYPKGKGYHLLLALPYQLHFLLAVVNLKYFQPGNLIIVMMATYMTYPESVYTNFKFFTSLRNLGATVLMVVGHHEY